MSLAEALESRVLLSAWYVTPAGLDSNSGSKTKPFQTIQQAANVAKPGDVVYIGGGTYRETIKPLNSGTSAAPITFKPMNAKQAVVIDGTDPLGGFAEGTGGLWQTGAMNWDLGDGNNQLFSNGQMLPEARWPDNPMTSAGLFQPNYATMSDASVGPGSGDMMTATISAPQLTQPAGTWVGATIHFSPGEKWAFATATVTASSPGSLTFNIVPFTDSPPQLPMAGTPFYLTGSSAAQDSSGEWVKDSSTGALSIVGSPPSDIEAKHRLYGFDLSGLSYINVTGINLFACTINTDDATSHVTLDGITAKYVSHRMDIADPFSVKLAPHTTGIILNGSDNLLENSTIDFSSGDGVFLGGTNNSVTNTTISNVDYAGGDEAGVTTMGPSAHVRYTTIFNAGRSGIRIDQPGVQIDHNRVYNVGLLTTDLGAIYAFEIDGTGSRIDYNVVSGVHTGGFGASGIHLDDGSSNFVVDHNVVWDCDFGIKFNPPSTNNLILNNTLLGTKSAVAVGSVDGVHPMNGFQFINNVFGGPTAIGIGATQTNNLSDIQSSQFLSPKKADYQPAKHSKLIDAGMVVAPYTDGFKGRAPDVGAYESGVKPFQVGAQKKRGKLK